jgi:hypothetical protein
LNRWVAVGIACLVTAPSARVAAELVEEEPMTFIDKLMAEIHGKIDAAIIARPPKLVPPKPIKLGWKLVKLGTLDLGGPLVALVAADLDADGKSELYAVTPREVLAIGLGGKAAPGPRILGRVAFAGERTPSEPRDVVATAVVDNGAIATGVSGWQNSFRIMWQNGVLAATPVGGGFLQCGDTLQLVPGRNYFGDGATGHYGTRCSALVDTDGHPLRTRSQLSLANKLDIAVERCAAAGLGCQPAARHEYAGVGIAFEVADVDRDGKPELVYAGAGAPGDPDALKIVTLGGDDKKPRLRKAFTAGGVAGIAVADLDGNGTPDMIAAVRLSGAPRVDLWRLQ